MRFNGEWLQCDDQIVRPVIRAEIMTNEGNWRSLELLVDTGADCTVISANVLETLNANQLAATDQLGGVGGMVESVVVNTQLRLMRDDGANAIFRGQYAACVNQEALDMSVLGRDLLDMFTLIVDRSAEVVAIIGGQHRYKIEA